MSTDLPEQPDAEDATFSEEDGVLYDEDVTPQLGILGFTLRELLIVGVWLVAFVVSFFPLNSGLSLWGIGIQWILPIGVPTVAVFLLVLRRFSPDGIRRVGSLGIDQFASVAFSVSATVWLGTLWLSVSTLIDGGFWGLPWNGIVMLLASLALVALTVFAPIIPGLKEDFHGRLVTLAHRHANPVRPVIERPRPERPERSEAADHAEAAAPASEPGVGATYAETAVLPDAADFDREASGPQATDEIARLDLAAQVPLASHASGGGTGTEQVTADEEYVPAYSRRSRGEEPEIVSDTGSIESLLGTAARIETGEHVSDLRASESDAERETEFDSDLDATNPRETPVPAVQPFWILAPSERDVHDERGEPLFRIGPNAWALVIEDRGGAYVIRHDDGRIGYLHEIFDITKG
ncbi:hypothetical protein [Microbacterium sp. SA39]|uniref:hypothetical protein n=1 Tax=Microbacterium sp. SA39 TaxID=1263625 RepID=UPI0005FA8892|nr:hypothetical protein [Microbacterium sp. SA39]KJQ54901.1 hypothetical protein RS85_01277 [Microbacterium sp. SA39]